MSMILLISGMTNVGEALFQFIPLLQSEKKNLKIVHTQN